MISVILYGRNDSYGYNLQKRAGISLNCFAEVLTDPDDEILFVDCNTPDDLPTFVEAIHDTLTPKAKHLLRVLRVRPDLHRKLVGYTHLMVVEPQPRNIAIRRSNPRNRWVLNTNTDVILLPRPGFRDLNHVVADLADGLYTLPRFELPEALWEAFPRYDPAAILDACRDLGPRLHLDEVTLSFPENRYDQVGDFQLAPRQTLFDIHGFDERMIHGWHCDTNISKRLNLYFGGRTESLAERMKAYHCDHTRVATGAHSFDIKLDNNVWEFVFSVESPYAQHQAETWGAPGEAVDEIDLTDNPYQRYIHAAEAALGAPQPQEYVADALGIRDYLGVQAEHVLPYLASDLTVYRRTARIAYMGRHARMRELAARAIAGLGFTAPLGEVASDSDPLRDFDVLIFDLSVDRSVLEGRIAERVTDYPRAVRHGLGAVARSLEELAERAAAEDIRGVEFVVINANHHLFWQFAGQFLLLTATPYAVHVRKGRPRMGDERRYRSSTWKHTEDALRSYFGYDLTGDGVLPVKFGETIDFTSAGKPGGYKDGHWGAMDYTGTWTDGDRAAFVFAPPATVPPEGVLLTVRVNEALIGPADEPIRVDVSLDGAPLAQWTFFTRYAVVDAKALVPASRLAGKSDCRLEFHILNPQSTAEVDRAAGNKVIGDDPRMFGFKAQRVEFSTPDRLRYRIGDEIDFRSGGAGAKYTNECWSLADEFGSWSFGQRPTVTLAPETAMDSRAQLVLRINDTAIADAHPTQNVRILVDGREVATLALSAAREAGDCRILLPRDLRFTTAPVTFTFEIEEPRTPVELGWSTWDKRPLGFRLERMSVVSAGPLKARLREPIDFVEDGGSLAFVGDATGTEWAMPGSRGSWTLGSAPTIALPFERPLSGDVPAAVVISDCMIAGPAPKLAVAVKANGHTVAEWAIEKRKVHRRSFTIPAAAIAAAPVLTLTFEIREPQSPASFGWSADDRPLGFQLARLVIGSSHADPPKFRLVGRERPMYQRLLGLPQYALHVARILWRRYRQ